MMKHEKVCRGLKPDQEKAPSLRRAVVSNQWDCVESDTESLAQERAYQKQLQMSITQNRYILPRERSADSLQHGDVEDDDDGTDDETGNLQICDSLEVEAQHHAKRKAKLSQTGYVDTQIDEKEGTSQLLSDDAYSDLRYDPNWRSKLAAGRFNESPQVSVNEYYQEKSSQTRDRQGVAIKGGYRYILYTSPAVDVTRNVAGNHSDQPYCLHPQDGQKNAATSFHCHTQADLSRPSSIFNNNNNNNESENNSQKGLRKTCENSCDDVRDNVIRSPELTEDKHVVCVQEFKTYYQQELGNTEGGSTKTEHVSSRKQNLERQTEDIVERNKVTLGRNSSKHGSYATVHALKQGAPLSMIKVPEKLKETAIIEHHEDSSDPRLRWLQKTQQLKVAQLSKGKKAQWREYLNPPQQQQLPALGVRAEQADDLSSPLGRATAATEPKTQKTTSSQPLPSTIHLNINLSTSSHLLPLLQQRGQDPVINVASPHGCPHLSPRSEVELASSPGYKKTNAEYFSQMSWKGVNAHLHHQTLESSCEQWQRTTAFQWPLYFKGEEQIFSPNEVYSEQTPTTTLSLGSGSYTVLPPIGQPVTGKECELSPGQSVTTACTIHRSSSNGYLLQMEKQKQLRARGTYKAYTLKDYKQLQLDINPRGLGPDYKAIEKTAEKMKRQRLYSNVIREQNKKISRIPFLPAKDPQGNDQKVPRMKALEYAKTIAKPSVQPQSKQKQKHQTEVFTGHAPYLEGLDLAQSDTLEVLRKRHEQEKKAVALLRKIHAV